MPDVREVRPVEHDRVGALVLAAYDAVGRIEGPYRDELAGTGRRVVDGSQVLVAVDGGDVLGTVTLVAAGSGHFEHEPHGDGGMRMLAVDPAAQGRGVGRLLIDTVLERARHDGWRRMVLTSMPWMRTAHRAYQARGFVRRPDLDLRFSSGTGLVFQLDLVDGAGAHFPPAGPVPVVPPAYVPGEDQHVAVC